MTPEDIIKDFLRFAYIQHMMELGIVEYYEDGFGDKHESLIYVSDAWVDEVIQDYIADRQKSSKV